LADCDFNRAALHPADPIKCHIEHVENADNPTGVHIAHHEPLPLDPLENTIGAQQAFPRDDARVSNAPIVLKKSVFE
jgi:hypothetical protein